MRDKKITTRILFCFAGKEETLFPFFCFFFPQILLFSFFVFCLCDKEKKKKQTTYNPFLKTRIETCF